MKQLISTVFTVSIIAILVSCETEKPWTPLFNGQNLENWDKYLGTPLNGFDSLAKVVTPEGVFSVIDENDEKLIRISGEVNGSLATRDTFSNFHLQLVFKWGDEIYTKQNSGLLYHSFGEFGKALGTWMVNIECQLMHERLGDTYLMNNTWCETESDTIEGGYIYKKGGELRKFNENEKGKSIKKALDAELPLGQWNTVDLYCFGRTSVHVVNGKVVMVNQNTGVAENGVVKPLTSGKIQLQSEGAELFIKTIQVKPIKEIPAELK
jgi:hypothetical protein